MNTTNPENPTAARLDTVGTNRWYLSAAPIVRALVHLCVPMAAAMIVGAVYNLINAGFIGSLHDPTLLAAITFGAPLLGLVMGVGGVFGVGGGALISRLLGAAEHEPAQGRRDQARRVVRRLGLGDHRGRARRHRAAPAAPARVGARRGRRRRARDQRLCRRHARVRSGARRGVLPRAARPGRGRRAPGDDRADRLHDRQRRVRRAVHPGAALGRRRRGAVDGPANLGVVIYFVVWLQRHSEHVSLAPRWFTLVAQRAEAGVRRRRRRAAAVRLPDRHLAGAQQPRGRLRRHRPRGNGCRGPHRPGAGVPGDGRHARRAAAARLLVRQGRPEPSHVGAARIRDHGRRHRRDLLGDWCSCSATRCSPRSWRTRRSSRSASRSSPRSSWR